MFECKNRKSVARQFVVCFAFLIGLKRGKQINTPPQCCRTSMQSHTDEETEEKNTPDLNLNSLFIAIFIIFFCAVPLNDSSVKLLFPLQFSVHFFFGLDLYFSG